MTTAVAAPPQTPPPKMVPAPVSPPAAPSLAVAPAAMLGTIGPPLYPITVAQYEWMGAAGILTATDRVELLNGLMVKKMAPNPPHATALALLRIALKPLVPDGWFERVQDPIALDVSMPEPDLALIRGDPRDFRSGHPRPADIGLLVEVAESSLATDRGEKLRAYAANGIVEYWIVNLVDARVEVYTRPSGPTAVPAYGSLQSYAPGHTVPLALDGAVVASMPVADVLP